MKNLVILFLSIATAALSPSQLAVVNAAKINVAIKGAALRPQQRPPHVLHDGTIYEVICPTSIPAANGIFTQNAETKPFESQQLWSLSPTKRVTDPPLGCSSCTSGAGFASHYAAVTRDAGAVGASGDCDINFGADTVVHKPTVTTYGYCLFKFTNPIADADGMINSVSIHVGCDIDADTFEVNPTMEKVSITADTVEYRFVGNYAGACGESPIPPDPPGVCPSWIPWNGRTIHYVDNSSDKAVNYHTVVSPTFPVDNPPDNQHSCDAQGYVSYYDPSTSECTDFTDRVVAGTPIADFSTKTCIYKSDKSGRDGFTTVVVRCDHNARELHLDEHGDITKTAVGGYNTTIYAAFKGVCKTFP